MTKSKIEWTDRVWNPVTGCDKVSQGCKNCYAETLAIRFWGNRKFTDVKVHDDRIMQPMTWKKPSRVFVNSMSDLFHEDVSFEFIEAIFSVMSDIDRHTYQILTKRPQRMLEFFHWKKNKFGIEWRPSNNVWLGVSCEDQETANERIPLLLKAPAAIHFLSCEPLLGPIDITNKGLNNGYSFPTKLVHSNGKIIGTEWTDPGDDFIGVDWVIVGGESGHAARPMHPEWVREIRDQCKKANTAFFFKQWGEYYTTWNYMTTGQPTFKMFQDKDQWINKGNTWVNKGDALIGIDGTRVKNGGDFDKCKYPVAIMQKVGKSKAGRELDGKTYDEYPKQIKELA